MDLSHRRRHFWARPVKAGKLGHKFGHCHMRQCPDRDSDVKTPGARELWSGQAKKTQPWTNKVCKEEKKQTRSKTLQELRTLSTVALNCQATYIFMNSGSQLSEL